MTDIKKQTFGIEIETVGKNRRESAWIVANLFNTTYHYVGGSYDKYVVKDSKNRKWTFVTDASLRGAKSCEIVSPVLGYEDIELLQNVVRALREGGCKANDSCGIHVHVGTEEATDLCRYFKNLSNIVESHYDILVKALAVSSNRLHWCEKNDKFQSNINKASAKTVDDVKKTWYRSMFGNISDASVEEHSTKHYDQSRYHLLNLHSYFQNKGVEFRAFNGTMHAGEIKAYVCLCLAMNTQAINKAFVGKRNISVGVNDAFAMSSWLYNMGLSGNEFKNVRAHLIKHLSGNLAYKNGESTSRKAL